MIYPIIIFILLIRSILYPFLRLFGLFSVKVRDRFTFEDRNWSDIHSIGFNDLAQKAEICFHISSEGELELIRPIIDQCLNQRRKIELIFTSPSVERQVMALAKLFPNQLTYLRLPALSFCLFPFPGSQNLLAWVSAKKMMMVRYDFFPELLLLKFYMQKFILFAASSKSRSNHDYRFKFKKKLYNIFDEIFPSTKEDEVFFKKKIKNVLVHTEIDLRSLQIQKRQRNSSINKTLAQLFARFNNSKTNVIFAQMWPKDMKVLNNSNLLRDIKNRNTFCYLAPHQLNDNFLAELVRQIDCPYYLISKNNIEDDIKFILENFEHDPRLIISLIPGVLCEIYPSFKYCYIGGGFGKGVHSLLEPFVAMCTIACGPNIFRSTEYDIANELGHKIKLYNEENLNSYYDDLDKRDLNLVDVSSFIKQNESKLNSVLNVLGILND